MNIEEKLKDLILTKYSSVRNFVAHTDFSYSTVDTMLRRGISNSSLSNVMKLCNYLEISVDELANNKIVPSGENSQTHYTEMDKMIEYAKRNILECNDLTLDGSPMTQTEIETMFDALEIGIEIIRRNRRRKKK